MPDYQVTQQFQQKLRRLEGPLWWNGVFLRKGAAREIADVLALIDTDAALNLLERRGDVTKFPLDWDTLPKESGLALLERLLTKAKQDVSCYILRSDARMKLHDVQFHLCKVQGELGGGMFLRRDIAQGLQEAFRLPQQ